MLFMQLTTRLQSNRLQKLETATPLQSKIHELKYARKQQISARKRSA